MSFNDLFKAEQNSTREPWDPLKGHVLNGVQNASNLLGAGTYQGPYTAPINELQNAGINAMGQVGSMMTWGQPNAYANYNMLANGVSQNPWLNNPNAYLGIANQVAANPYLDSQITAALRDPYRGLTENTLPGIDRAFGGADAGHSKGEIASAVATRGYEDRASDVGAFMRGNAYNQGLGFANTAAVNDQQNQFQSNQYLAQLGQQGVGMLSGAGDYQQGLEQGQIEGNIAQFYEPWRVQEAYDKSLTPYVQSLASDKTTYGPESALGPLLSLGGQVLNAPMPGTGSSGSILDNIFDAIFT